MGSYRNDDEALIGLARQLTDAYAEARTREDQDYACESIAEFLSEFRQSAPSEALLAFLGLPLTAETYPLVDEAQMALAARGPAVVELLLEAVLGAVYDPDGPASERAAETIDELPRGEASLGLTEVLCGDGDDALKGAAVDGLVALGGLAEPDLVAILDDPEGGEWAVAALEQIRFAFEHPGAGVDDELEGVEPDDEDADELDDDDAGEASDDDWADAADGDADEPGDESAGAAIDDTGAGLALDDQPGAVPGTAAEPVTGPDGSVVDAAYEDFLRRFEEDGGGEPSS
jgi:hypothetical protein